MRLDDGWELFLLHVCELCVEHAIEIPYMKETYILRGSRAHRQHDYFIN